MRSLSKPHTWARSALAAAGMAEGLSVSEVHERLQLNNRLGDAGQRGLAFYLADMAERGLHQCTGHRSAPVYAEDRLDIDRRRAAELIRVGRKLRSLRKIDEAFAKQRIGWSKVLLVAKVAVPEHEQAWLEQALESNCGELKRAVRRVKEGEPPRDPENDKGLPEVRFRVGAQVNAITHKKVDLAMRKLSDERGGPVDLATCMEIFADLVLGTDEDGSVRGRKRVDASLYRVEVRPFSEGGPLAVDTEAGPIPIEGADCIECDADSAEKAPKTPPALRRRVLARDGGRCRCCGSTTGLMVHHVVFRSKGGRTVIENLISLCARCHALVHDNLLFLKGANSDEIRFEDAEGRVLHEPADTVDKSVLLELDVPEPDSEPEPERVPDPERKRRISGGPDSRDPVLEDPDLEEVVGQDALVARLRAAAEGSRARGLAFPHMLLTGPPGTGKTTLARGVAAHCRAALIEQVGPLVSTTPAMLRLLSSLEPGDMLFLDEIHAIPRTVLELLYQAMVERRVRDVEIAPFTLLAATTEEADLPEALVGRFGLRESLSYYRPDDLAALAVAQAKRREFDLARNAGRLLAVCAKGTPRETLRLLERVFDAAACRETRLIDERIVRDTLAKLGYDLAGLCPQQQRYLEIVRTSPGPISLRCIARLLGIPGKLIGNHLEPFLLSRGLVQITARGRMAA